MYSFQLLPAPRNCASCGTTVAAGLAGHHYRDPMCETCFRLVAPDLVESFQKLQSITSIEHLDTVSAECGECGASLEAPIAGHHRRDPLCVPCFRRRAPDLAALFRLEEKILRAAKVSILLVRSATVCSGCGDQLRAARFAGHHYGDPLCFDCFFKLAPVLAALLRLDEAALEAADNRDSRALLEVAVSYSNLLYRLDADHPRDQRPAKARPDRRPRSRPPKKVRS